MIDYRGISQRGNSRKGNNQDCIFMRSTESNGIFAISDGMGGLPNGELASQRVIDAIQCWWEESSFLLKNRPITVCIDELERELSEVNNILYADKQLGGATIVLLLIVGNAYAILNAGDSRIYFKDIDEDLLQMSSDDIWENDTGFTQGLTDIQIQTSRERGKLTNAVGVTEEFIPSTNTGSLHKKSLFLLMSDGIYKFCPSKILSKAAESAFDSNHLESAEEEIVQAVYAHGAKDNLSLIVVSFR